jgi:hypothetical protein
VFRASAGRMGAAVVALRAGVRASAARGGLAGGRGAPRTRERGDRVSGISWRGADRPSSGIRVGGARAPRFVHQLGGCGQAGGRLLRVRGAAVIAFRASAGRAARTGRRRASARWRERGRRASCTAGGARAGGRVSAFAGAAAIAFRASAGRQAGRLGVPRWRGRMIALRGREGAGRPSSDISWEARIAGRAWCSTLARRRRSRFGHQLGGREHALAGIRVGRSGGVALRASAGGARAGSSPRSRGAVIASGISGRARTGGQAWCSALAGPR